MVVVSGHSQRPGHGGRVRERERECERLDLTRQAVSELPLCLLEVSGCFYTKQTKWNITESEAKLQ